MLLIRGRVLHKRCLLSCDPAVNISHIRTLRLLYLEAQQAQIVLENLVLDKTVRSLLRIIILREER